MNEDERITLVRAQRDRVSLRFLRRRWCMPAPSAPADRLASIEQR